MTKKRITIRILAPLALLTALAAAPALAERIERDYHETFDVRPGAQIRLDHGDGDVTVTPWGKDVVEIDVRYRAQVSGLGRSQRGEFEVEFDHSGDTIRVVGREPSFSGVVLSFREHEYTYTVRAPAYVELRLQGEDGDVAIEGWRAPVEARLEDGNLRLTDVEAERFTLELEDGDLTIRELTGNLVIEAADGEVVVQGCSSKKADVRTEDGDVRIARCAGDWTVFSEDGEVELDEMRAGELAIETEDGDVVLDLAASPRELTVTTQDGTVEVSAPADLSAELDVSTGDGRIRVDYPGAHLSRDGRRADGRLGAGEGRVRITTQDGDVTLRSKG